MNNTASDPVSIAEMDLHERAELEARLLSYGASAPQTATSRSELAPLTHAQESLWFLHQLSPGLPTYNMPQAFRVSGPLDRESLARAFRTVVERHEALRATIVATDSSLGQRALPGAELTISFNDLTSLPANQQAAQTADLLELEAGQPFDVTRMPPCRVRLIRLADCEHILTITAHHLFCDMESLGVIYKEVAVLYDAYGRGDRPLLDENIPQFLEFAAQVGTKRQVEIIDNFWRGQLGGGITPLQFLSDTPGKRSEMRGALHHFDISAELTSSLLALSQRAEASLYMTLLGSFQVFGCRYTGQSEFLLGTLLSQRDFPNAEKMVGYLVNLLVLPLRLARPPTFLSLLQRLRALLLEAYAHPSPPLDETLAALRLPRTDGRHPLCRVMFQYLPGGTAELKLAGLDLEPLPVHTRTSKFDLTLTLAARHGGLRGEIEFDTALFAPETVRRMAEHFEILLRSIVGNPNRDISGLSLQSPAERRQLVEEWNQTHSNYPASATIHQVFEWQAIANPERVALLFNQEKVTYRELNERANCLASRLRAIGIEPGEPVGLCLERSVEMIVGLLGILKAGGAYVPFDPAYPGARLNEMLSDSQVRLFVTEPRFAALACGGARSIAVNGTEDGPSHAPRKFADANDPECLAYILYTSGSTGAPKGVAVPHRAVVRLVKEMNYARVSGEEVFLQFAPICFDASTFEIWGALLNSATLAIYPSRFDSLEQFEQVLRAYKVTTLWLTAGLFNQIADANIKALDGVRQLLVGGDVLSVPHIKRAQRELPATELINGYGPTENTTFTCCYSLPRDWPDERSIPIGRPISNTQAYLLDSALQPVGLGVPGELYAGGDGVARGYWNRPDLTAERFIPDPFSGERGRRLYRTGDRARWLPDGTIEFLGRTDTQVKIRGFRIELGEVERALASLDGVQNSVTAVHIDAAGAKSLVAYIVGAPGQEIAEPDLRLELAARIPAHAVPSRFIRLERLPLNTNGKVDRAALPPPEAVVSPADAESTRPRNDTETRLLEIWRTVLRQPALTVTTNFFEAGGHSLLATSLVMQINKAFGTGLSLASLFEMPSVRSLAQKISEQGRSAPKDIIPHRAARNSTRSRPTGLV